MNFFIFLTLSVCHVYGQIPLITANNSETKEKCAFEQTVNLTNCHRFENGSYLYQGILIPLEKQSFYDYELKFSGANKSVPVHLRGCGCDKKPCMKLCCDKDEFLDITSKCKKLTDAMQVRWDLLVEFKNSGESKRINIFKHFTTQMGLPCDKPEAFDYSIDTWILKEDGKLHIKTENLVFTTNDYCYSPRFLNNSINYELIPYSCPTYYIEPWNITLSRYATAISVPFLIITIVVNFVFKQLRENMRLKILTCYFLSLTMGYGIISFINISATYFNYIKCSFVGFTGYFFYMAANFWLSVFCFEFWKNFKETYMEMDCRKKNRKQFMIYSLYAWLSASLATGVIIVIGFSGIDEEYKPGIGETVCFVNMEKWSAVLYFYGPSLIAFLIYIVTFAYLAAKICKVRRDLPNITHSEHISSENVIVVLLRLFVIMGITFPLDFLAYCVRDYKGLNFFFVISDLGNAIQGILVFGLFVFKPSVRELFKKINNISRI